MLGFVLKLLGWGKTLLRLAFEYWYVILGIIAVVAGYFYINGLIDNAYDQGVLDEKALWEARIERENEENRVMENKLDNVLSVMIDEFDDLQRSRIKQEEIAQDIINNIISSQPEVYEQCLIDPEIIRQQNIIRRGE